MNGVNRLDDCGEQNKWIKKNETERLEYEFGRNEQRKKRRVFYSIREEDCNEIEREEVV